MESKNPLPSGTILGSIDLRHYTLTSHIMTVSKHVESIIYNKKLVLQLEFERGRVPAKGRALF
jgi:hypothetical protein